MSGKKQDTQTQTTSGAKSDRDARLSQALRANLKRRKAQVKGRDAQKSADDEDISNQRN